SAGAQLRAGEADCLKLDHLAVEPQRSGTARIVGVALELEPGVHPRAGRVQRDVEIDVTNEVVGRPVVLELNGSWRVGFHRWYSGAVGRIGDGGVPPRCRFLGAVIKQGVRGASLAGLGAVGPDLAKAWHTARALPARPPKEACARRWCWGR